MKVLYSEDLTNHTDLESCGEGGNILAEALTEESTGGQLSSEITTFWVSTLYSEGEDNTYRSVRRELQYDPTESENLACVEASYVGTGRSRDFPYHKERAGKEKFQSPAMNDFWKSDNEIVPKSQSNKGGVLLWRRLRREGR